MGKQFEKILLKHGWEKIPNWECLFVHREKRLFLSVYVYDGTRDNWRQFKFTFLGYAGAIDSRLQQVMIESEVLQEHATMNSALLARDQRVATQLYYMLVLLLEG